MKTTILILLFALWNTVLFFTDINKDDNEEF
jgi:hypothetical protein